MMTSKNKAGSKVKTKSKTTSLTPLEEKVIRMRRGLRAPDDLVLEQVGQDDSMIAGELKAIEERAIAAVSARKSPEKRKIVKALRRKRR